MIFLLKFDHSISHKHEFVVEVSWLLKLGPTKGQLFSEWIFVVLIFQNPNEKIWQISSLESKK